MQKLLDNNAAVDTQKNSEQHNLGTPAVDQKLRHYKTGFQTNHLNQTCMCVSLLTIEKLLIV